MIFVVQVIILVLALAMAICNAMAYRRYTRPLEDLAMGFGDAVEDLGHASIAAVEDALSGNAFAGHGYYDDEPQWPGIY